MRSVQILILGGGASGMAAAITAAQAGAKVLVIEKMKQPGKKILATGNGKCNFTNLYQDTSCYRGNCPQKIKEALEQFGKEDVLKWFARMGVWYTEKNGYVYPASGQASSVRDALQREMELCGVKVQKEESVEYIEPRKNGYVVQTDVGKYLASCVILALGGNAAPMHGTCGDGAEIAKALGIKVEKPLPALTSCVLEGKFMKNWTGVRTQGKVSLYDQSGMLLAEDAGELQFVNYGISGIPVFQISRYAARDLAKKGKPYLLMDVMPKVSEKLLYEELKNRKKRFGSWKKIDALDGMLHRKLAAVLLETGGIGTEGVFYNCSEEELRDLASRMKAWKLNIHSVSGFDKAQVTCGGISLEEISIPEMEVKKYPGMYAVGELLDVDGICGGYNLQWAWTTGVLAGRNAAAQKTGGK